MKTLQSLAEIILKPLGLDTDAIEVEAIKQRVLSYRQEIIRQDYNRNRRMPAQLIQAFDVSLQEVQEREDRFFVSTKLPKPILLTKQGSPFESVHTSYKGRSKQPLNYIAVERVPYIKYRSFTRDGNFYTYENDIITVLTDAFVESPSIRIRAVWDSPIQVHHFAKQEVYKLACSEDIISSPCIDGDEIILEETLAARILTFFNPGNNATRSRERDQETGD